MARQTPARAIRNEVLVIEELLVTATSLSLTAAP
jgi:hypothetical protein